MKIAPKAIFLIIVLLPFRFVVEAQTKPTSKTKKAAAEQQKMERLEDASRQSTVNLIMASQAYIESLEKLVQLLKADIASLERKVAEQDRRIAELETSVKKISPSIETKASEGQITEGMKSNNNGWKNPSTWDRIKDGMSERQVISILGQPTSIEDIGGGYRTLFYRGEVLRSGFVSGNIKLHDDRVWEVNKPVF